MCEASGEMLAFTPIFPKTTAWLENNNRRGISNKKVSSAKAKRGILADASFAQAKSRLLWKVVIYQG
jgi:hypothetical protein